VIQNRFLKMLISTRCSGQINLKTFLACCGKAISHEKCMACVALSCVSISIILLHLRKWSGTNVYAYSTASALRLLHDWAFKCPRPTSIRFSAFTSIGQSYTALCNQKSMILSQTTGVSAKVYVIVSFVLVSSISKTLFVVWWTSNPSRTEL